MTSRSSYCTVRFTVLAAVAPPLALLAVTMTAEVPAGVPNPFGPGVGVGPGAGVLLTPQPAVSTKTRPAKAVASLIFFALEFFERVSARASAVSPIKPSSTVICGGTPFGSGKADERAVVAIDNVTGVAPAAVTDAGLKLQVLAAGRPLQAKVTAPRLPL